MELEKSCEFCLTLRPIVYCKADAAHLCLSCDAKVHSANALSYRHPRTVVCEACRYSPAYVQCSDHRMFMCRGCNRSQHDLSSQHQRKVISCYMGCPSAKDFAALWGFDLNRFLPTTSPTVDTGMVTFNNPRQSCSGAGSSSASEVTPTVLTLPKLSSGEYHKVPGANAPNQWENIGHILQQILDLKMLQLTQDSANSSHVKGQEESDVSSFEHNTKGKLHENLDQQLQQSLDLDSDLRNLGSSHEKPTAESFPYALSQMDGDTFWQCKSPVQSGQLWTQNMQDLGVCDDLGCLDDFSMPDVDLTFKNIEDLFGGEQELATALLDDKDTTCSSMGKDMSIDKSDNGYDRSVEDVSAASSVYVSHSANLEKEIESSDNVNHFSTTKEHPSIKPSYSTLSFSFSRLNAQYLDSGQSSDYMRQYLSYNLSDLENVQLDSKQNAIMRHKEKKKIRKCEQQSRYTPRKARSDVKKSVRDQFVKMPDCESDAVNIARSF